MDLKLRDKVALVCGSSSGLGLAIGKRLSVEGCRVALNGRDDDRLRSAVRSVAADTDGDVEGFQADVSVREDAEQLVQRVHDRFGSLDILLCNAGGPRSTGFDDTRVDEWQAALDLNLLSTIHLCRAAIPHMTSANWGRVICLTSVAAKEPLPGLILSTTARAGVLGFAKSLADEVAPAGVTVNVVCPGFMKTGRVDDLVHQRSQREKRAEGQIWEELTGRIPMKRVGDPDELGATVAFLASPLAGYITGVALAVDGGYIRGIV